MRRIKEFGLLLLVAFTINACDDEDAKPTPPNLPVYDIQIKVNHQFDGSALEMNQEKYVTGNDDTISVSRWMYHLNKFRFYSNGKEVSRPDKYFLIDADDASSLTLQFDSLDNLAFDSVTFDVGVRDSVDNADGVLNSMFTDPMYWGMINGYINMKLEGRCNSVASDSLYLLHIGGYMGNYKLGQTVTINFGTNKLQNKLGFNVLTLDVDLAEYFENPNIIDLSTSNRIHSPNDAAKEISDNWPGMFSFGSIN